MKEVEQFDDIDGKFYYHMALLSVTHSSVPNIQYLINTYQLAVCI
jgi:hypothetical protein